MNQTPLAQGMRTATFFLLLTVGLLSGCGGGGGGTSTPSYTVGTTAQSGGSISPASRTVTQDRTTSFTVSPDTGYSIDSVTGCGGSLSGDTYTTGPITSACMVSASFSLNTYTVSATAGANGSIAPSGQTVDHGATTSFTVIPDTDYGIASVTGCGGSLSGDTYTTGPITSACTVSASFSLNTYTVSATAGANGSIAPGGQIVDHGATTSFTVTPDTGYSIDSVTGCGGSLSGDTYTTGPITSACTVSVSFSLPRLDAEAQSEQVRLTWTDMGAGSYSLYYASAPGCDTSNYSLCPGGTLVTNVTAPYTVTGLTNGQNYWFQLEAAGVTAVYNEAGARPDKMVLNDRVLAIAHDASGATYLGGDFTWVGVRTGYGVPLSLATGHAGAFPLVNGTISAAAADGAGGFYIGGSFTSVGGVTRNRLAHILADGTLGAWNPDANGTVNALAIAGSTVYAGGLFTTVNGQARNRLAAIGSDGTLGAWNPDANSTVYALAVAGSTVYAGGSFTTVGGQTRNRLAAIGSDGTLGAWNPDANNVVNALAVAGSTVYAGGTFTTVDGQTRNYLAAIGSDGTLGAWNPDANGTVVALAVAGSTVYAGGQFTTVGGQTRNRLAAIGSDGTLGAWNPDANSTVYALAVAGSTVYAGGYFLNVGGDMSPYFAALAP